MGSFHGTELIKHTKKLARIVERRRERIFELEQREEISSNYSISIVVQQRSFPSCLEVSLLIDLRPQNQLFAAMSGSNEFSDEDEDKVKVCQGLTDEERRDIRKSQRILRKEIPDLDIDEARARNNEIHKKVRYIRESVLDAENLDEIAKKATIKVDQMVQVRKRVGSGGALILFAEFK